MVSLGSITNFLVKGLLFFELLLNFKCTGNSIVPTEDLSNSSFGFIFRIFFMLDVFFKYKVMFPTSPAIISELDEVLPKGKYSNQTLAYSKLFISLELPHL